jgi:hypothetical protein
MNAQVHITPLDARVQGFIAKPRPALIDGRWVPAKSGNHTPAAVNETNRNQGRMPNRLHPRSNERTAECQRHTR